MLTFIHVRCFFKTMTTMLLLIHRRRLSGQMRHLIVWPPLYPEVIWVCHQLPWSGSYSPSGIQHGPRRRTLHGGLQWLRWVSQLCWMISTNGSMSIYCRCEQRHRALLQDEQPDVQPTLTDQGSYGDELQLRVGSGGPWQDHASCR